MTDQQSAAETVMDDPAQLRGLAAQHRADAAAAKAEAETNFEAVRAEAERLLREAQHRLSQADVQYQAADRKAVDLEGRAALLDHAEALRQQIDATTDVVAELRDEAESLGEQIAGLDSRLAELGTEREDVTAQLASAREAGDVDAVLAHRSRIGAIDEVAGVIQGQRQTAQDRLAAIVDPGSGELAEAVGTWESKRAELRRVENEIDPSRPEALHDAAMEEFRAVLAANAERIREEQAQAQPRANRREFVPIEPNEVRRPEPAPYRRLGMAGDWTPH